MEGTHQAANSLARSSQLCVLYVSFGSTLRPITFVRVTIVSVMLFILSSILLLYSPVSAVNRLQVGLSRFGVRHALI